MGSNKSLSKKTKIGVMIKKNRALPNWIRYRTDNKIRYNAKRRHWRRTKIGFWEIDSFHLLFAFNVPDTCIYVWQHSFCHGWQMAKTEASKTSIIDVNIIQHDPFFLFPLPLFPLTLKLPGLPLLLTLQNYNYYRSIDVIIMINQRPFTGGLKWTPWLLYASTNCIYALLRLKCCFDKFLITLKLSSLGKQFLGVTTN